MSVQKFVHWAGPAGSFLVYSSESEANGRNAIKIGFISRLCLGTRAHVVKRCSNDSLTEISGAGVRMQNESRIVSFYEISSDLTVRLGSGELDEVLCRYQPDPGISVCVREQVTQDAKIRLRFGRATLTDEGLLPHIPVDEMERRGVWAASFPVVMSAMALLQSLSRSQLEEAISTAPPSGWLVFDLPGTRLHPVTEPRSDWYDCESKLGTQALVRVGGDPEQIAQILARSRDEERARRVLESDQPANL